MLSALKGKVALVTGAASGIGKGIASTLARNGARVAVVDLNGEAAEKTAQDLGGLGVQCNVTVEADVKRAVDATVAKYGRLDVVVNNAGVQHIAPVAELELSDWKRMLEVHLDGAFLFTREALRQMYAQNEQSGSIGHIIYVGSVHSKEASVLKAPYVTAKHGIIGLARTVAKEGGDKGVSTTTVCPGFVLTPLVEKQIPEQADTLGISEEEVVANVMLKNNVSKEFATVDDIANAVAYVASHDSLVLTGQSMTLSHGWHMA